MNKAKKYLRNRRRILQYADGQLAAARELPTDECGYLMPHDWNGLLLHLHQARQAYRAAGLGLLAGRLDFLHRRVVNAGMAAVVDERVEVHSLWRFFDRLNELTGLATEGGCS